nr:uncharacterized protein LOC109158201 isoform X1 [Ipomoea trifida]
MYALNLRPSIYHFPRSPNPRSLPHLRPLLHSHNTLLQPQILSPTRFTRIPITSSTTFFSNFPTDSPENDGDDSTLNHTTLPSGKQFLENASWIGLATITSKIMGLLREIVMASVFGVGPVAIAFSKLPEERQKKLFQHTSIILFLGGSVFAALVFIFAEFIIHAYAPGLCTLVEGEATREIAIKQLKVMSSCIAVAGPIGLGYAYMSASFILSVDKEMLLTMALVLKGAWHINVPYLQLDTLASYDVSKFFSLLLPATFSSGLEHIASFTDLYFASRVPGAVAGLSYSIGTPFFIVRELLVAVFYSLGDGQRPFLVSISAIGLNAILDWFLVCRYFLGGQGLALSTSATAALSVVILILLLQKKLAGVFHYAELIYPALLLSICCLVSSLTTSISHDLLVQMLTLICRKRLGRVAEALSICLASATGIISFFVPVILVYLSGFKMPGLSGLLGWLTNKPETVP